MRNITSDFSNPEDYTEPEYGIIFRRFVTRNGITYDAHDYGKKAFKIKIRLDKKKVD